MDQTSFNLCVLVLLLSLRECFCTNDPYYESCAPKTCGNGLNISYPFYIQNHQPPFCGYPGFELTCSKNGYPLLYLPENEFKVDKIYYNNESVRLVYHVVVEDPLGCVDDIRNTTVGGERFVMANEGEVVLLTNCSKELLSEKLESYEVGCGGNVNGESWGLVMRENDENLGEGREVCGEEVVVFVDVFGDEMPNAVVGKRYEDLLLRGFLVNWIAEDCNVCQGSGGRCGYNHTSLHFMCFCPDRPHSRSCKPGRKRTSLILFIGLPGAAFILISCSVVFIMWRRWRHISPHFDSKNNYKDLEDGSLNLGIHVFSYTELEEATNKFDPARELGDGGFGTVYHGKLQDGREVAVKQLYEHNYKRVEQFMNEVEILTRLRHPNLVLLYGCTSYRCRELLLVYEYVPNGTVADHLHGDRTNPSSLTWPIRMNIAIETASALAYLHASDIIHRDVKTNNILLDDNFCVKVADFGISRLFPNDVTHISTAPQGTPGYVDPEYHQCYQLTDKSDVYSFGVVLIELISSMPAVDISRHRHEINLANLAINKIQRSAFSELVDPSLGFDTNPEVERMTTSIAELVFRCVQYDRDLRPTMNEVLDVLKAIRDGPTKEASDSIGNSDNVKTTASPETEDVILLKSTASPVSPSSVADQWYCSTSTTDNSR